MLENWLKKVNPEISSEISSLSSESIGRSIKIHKELFPVLDDCQVVLLSDNSLHMDQIRMQFYEMYHHFDNLFVADLGDLRNTDTNFLISLFTELLESNLTPIIFTSDKTLIHTFHFALNAFHNSFKNLYCGKKIPFYSDNDYANMSKLTSIGIQGHYNSNTSLKQSNLVRLSDIKNKIEESEPYTRDTDTIVLNLNIIKQSDIPGHLEGSPSGLDADEATQLFRYCGFNDQLKALFIFGYDSQYDFNRQSAKLIAQGLWYYMDARNHCITENINSNEDFHEFIVDIEGLETPIAFIKAKRSGRWWIKSTGVSHELIPCSHSDYLLACNNEIPDRLFQ